MKKLPASRPHAEWLHEQLQDPVFAAEYLSAAAEDEPAVYLGALRHVVEAHGTATEPATHGTATEPATPTLIPEHRHTLAGGCGDFLKGVHKGAPKQFYLKTNRKILLDVEVRLLPAAMKGEYWAVCQLLLTLSEAIRQKVPLTPKLSAYLATALRSISDGKDPKSVFNIHRKRGQKDTRVAVDRAIMRAGNVALKVAINGMAVGSAIAEVANEEQGSKATVKAAWRDYRKNVEVILDDVVLILPRNL